MLSDIDLLALNKRGLIPGPQENAEQFLQRINRDEQVENQLTPDEWKEAHTCTQNLFDFSADWVKAFYSKKQLPFWQGAVTWMGDPPLIQLHPGLKKGNYLRLYSRKEVLAHEAVHAMRTPLSASRFEEYFAYLTSRSWRSKFGPLFRTSGEGTLFLCLLALSTLAAYLSIWMPALGWVFGLPWILLILGVLRLGWMHRVLRRCEKHLRGALPRPDQARFVLVRLTDQEIAKFATLSSSDIYAYAEAEKGHYLRWKVLFLAYF